MGTPCTIQVLYVMWQHKELHDGFKRSGLKESDFYSGTTSRARDSTTLARPISSQGAERPANLRSENLDDSGSGSGTGRYGAMGSTCSVIFILLFILHEGLILHAHWTLLFTYRHSFLGNIHCFYAWFCQRSQVGCDASAESKQWRISFLFEGRCWNIM